jgi:thiamine kinase-like enzyme
LIYQNRLEKNRLEQNRYSNFIKTTLFSESFNQAVNKIAGKKFPGKNIALFPLTGDMTPKKIFLLTLNGKRYVLKILNLKHDIESKKNEIMAHTYAAQIGLAPPLTYVDEKLQFVIMPYIEGDTLNSKDLDDPKVIRKIGESLAKLHCYQSEFNQCQSQSDRIKKHFESAQKKEAASPSPYLYKEIYEASLKEDLKHLDVNQNTEDLVLCHGDLSPENIIIGTDGALYFINWRSTIWDSRYKELACFYWNNILNGFHFEKPRLLVSAYFGGAITDIQWKKFETAQNHHLSFLIFHN